MTPYELSIHIEAFAKKREMEQEERMTLVWMGEYLHRVEKLPPLKEILGKKDDEMTDDEMLDTVKQLNSLFGGTVVSNNEDVSE
jgi:hypothetical protein